MVAFTSGEKSLFVGTVCFNIVLNTVSLLVAIHNTIMYVCRPRHRKFLINMFYMFIITALSFKILHDVYLLYNRQKIYNGIDLEYEEKLLYLVGLLEDCLYISYILMTY